MQWHGPGEYQLGKCVVEGTARATTPPQSLSHVEWPGGDKVIRQTSTSTNQHRISSSVGRLETRPQAPPNGFPLQDTYLSWNIQLFLVTVTVTVGPKTPPKPPPYKLIGHITFVVSHLFNGTIWVQDIHNPLRSCRTFVSQILVIVHQAVAPNLHDNVVLKFR
jgi:hypothetical protein